MKENKLMKSPICALVAGAAFVLTLGNTVHAADPPASLRIGCEGAAVGAAVTVNNKFKGDCPIDVDVAPGTIVIRASKKIAGKEEVFKEEVRLGSGARKRIDVRFASQGNAAPVAAAPAIDYKAIAMQKYEAELQEYRRSVEACKPRHAEIASQLKEAWTSAAQTRFSMCNRWARASFPDQSYADRINCGTEPDNHFNLTRDGFDSPGDDYEHLHQRFMKAKKAYMDFPNAEAWCQRQFSAPIKPE